MVVVAYASISQFDDAKRRQVEIETGHRLRFP